MLFRDLQPRQHFMHAGRHGYRFAPEEERQEDGANCTLDGQRDWLPSHETVEPIAEAQPAAATPSTPPPPETETTDTTHQATE